MKQVFLFIFILAATSVWAQKYTISGYITDSENGEKLIGANVYNAKTLQGTVTNNYGFYSLTLEAGELELTVSFVGYAAYTEHIDLNKSIKINVELKPSLELEEVVVEGEKSGLKIQSSQMSVVQIPIKTIAKLPSFMGEPDLIKSIQLLPGVQSGTEGMSGMYVRGGGPDQNLILLDGVPVYNVNHLFGFFSVFNTDAVQNVKLIKGGFPARYGGRLSSVLDISMKEGNSKEFKGSASVGIIASKLTLEGPINEKSSFIITGRRTYIDVLAWPIIKIAQAAEDIERLRTGYYFYDLNAKANYRLSDKSRLYLSAYMGKDRFYTDQKDSYTYDLYDPLTGNYENSTNTWEDQGEIWWGNITSSLRWNYQINDKLFSNTTLTYSRYKMLTGFSYYESYQGHSNSEEINYNSGINDLGSRVDFDFFPTPAHTIKFGLGNTNHEFNPGIFASQSSSEDTLTYSTEAGNSRIVSNELEAYIEDDMKLGSLVKINAGLHFTSYLVRNKNYFSVQPRISGRVQLTEKWSAKASFAQMDQYINLLTNSNIGLPTDLWVPSTDLVKPMRAWQSAVGTMIELPHDFEFSVEAFYKKMNNLQGYKEGASYFSIENDWETKLEAGEGWSYGVEVLIMRSVGNTTGWIGYTWSKAENKFPGQNQGEAFPFNFDRRHDISIVLTHRINDHTDFGLTWVYGSGYPKTLGTQEYLTWFDQVQQQSSDPNYYYYGSYATDIQHKNNYRLPAYHRLDLSISFHKQKKHGVRTWTWAVYNAYNRKNAFYIDWENDYNGFAETQKLYKYSLFPIMPSVSYKYDF